MSARRSVVAGLAIIAIVGCSDSVTDPDAFDVGLSASALEGLDPCVGDLKLTTQAEVDAFNCTSVDGDVWIGPSTDISNVAALSDLGSVGGSVVLDENPLLTNLDGLSSVTSVGDLVFLRNSAVLNTDGLSSLDSISGLLIVYSDALPNLDGLSSLKSVLDIDMSGSSLTRIELPALDSVRNFWVQYNAVLEELNVPRLAYAKYLLVVDNDALTRLNFTGLVEIGFLEAYFNDALPSLDGLEALATADWIRLDSNAALEHVDALSSLSSLNQLDITNNPALAKCALGLGTIVSSWDPANERLHIENNAPGCNSPAEIVAEACPKCTGFGPVISVDIPSIDWSFVEGDTDIRTTSVAISNTGAGTLSDLSVAIDDVTPSTGWLDVQLNSSTAPPDATADVTVDPSGLAVGTHVAEFTVSSPDVWNAAEVRVVVDVAPRSTGLPVIRTSVPDISWSILRGDEGRPSRSTSLWITNGGGGTLAGLTASVDYAREPSDWVHIGMDSPVAQGVQMTVDLDALDLPVGTHVAEVTVSSPTATNSVEIRIVVEVRWRPDAPSGLTATNANMDVTLLWTDNSDDEDEFRIERRQLPNGEWSEIKEVPANTASFVDGVTTADWYSYRVRACNAAGCSSYVGLNQGLPVPAPPKLEFRPARSVEVSVVVGGSSASATVWMVNVGGVPQHWFADRYESPIGWSARPGAGIIPPGDSMAVVMTAFPPQSWEAGPPLPWTSETAMLMRDPINWAWLGGVGLRVTLFR